MALLILFPLLVIFGALICFGAILFLKSLAVERKIKELAGNLETKIKQ